MSEETYYYAGVPQSVVDGDTVIYKVLLPGKKDLPNTPVDESKGHWEYNVPIHMLGIKAPEVGTPDGDYVKQRVEAIVLSGNETYLQTFKDMSGGTGKWKAIIWVIQESGSGGIRRINLNCWLKMNGLCKPLGHQLECPGEEKNKDAFNK